MSRVSIIIPTLNRSHLLRTALKSAINQTYRDIEIIVSDDCSEDDTRELALSTGDPRVRYVRTPARIDMAKSFEFALGQARGEYLTFLTDDSYLVPECIATAIGASDTEGLGLVVWRHAGYFDSHWLEPQRRNTMYVPTCSYQHRRLSSRASLELWFRKMREVSASMPRSINSLCHRDIIALAVSRQGGGFFLPPAPDHSSGVGMLMNTSEYVLIDESLVVDGVTRESIGPSQSFNFGKSAQDFYKSFGKSMKEVTFLGLPTTPAIIAKAFQNTRAHYPDAPELDSRTIVDELVDSIAKLQVYGVDVKALWEVLDAYLIAEQPSLRRFARFRRIRSGAKWRAVKTIRSSSVLSRAEGFRRMTLVQGSRAGFKDIEGAAAHLRRINTYGRQGKA